MEQIRWPIWCSCQQHTNERLTLFVVECQWAQTRSKIFVLCGTFKIRRFNNSKSTFYLFKEGSWIDSSLVQTKHHMLVGRCSRIESGDSIQWHTYSLQNYRFDTCAEPPVGKMNQVEHSRVRFTLICRPRMYFCINVRSITHSRAEGMTWPQATQSELPTPNMHEPLKVRSVHNISWSIGLWNTVTCR